MRNKLIQAFLLLQCVLVATVIYLSFKNNEDSLDFSCKGENIYNINRGSEKTSIVTNISLSFFKSKEIHAIVHGFVSDPAGTRTISREYNYKYRVINEKEGRYVSSLYKVTRTENDNDDRSTVSNFLFGGESSDVNFRISRLGNNVLIFGNVFTPIFSCTVTSS